MKIEPFFDKATYTLTYVVFDEKTRDAVIIDPVLDYDSASSTYSFRSIEQVSKLIEKEGLKVHYILETHAHADHLSGSQKLKSIFSGAQSVIGGEITQVQEAFKGLFNFDSSFKTDGSQFDVLLKDGEVLKAGSLSFEAIHTPGHTPACYSFKIEDVVFTGDALFMPDFGVARCDFPGGSAETLYESITQKLFSLPNETRVFTGHDYQPGDRELKYETTIGESKKSNIHLNSETTRDEFVQFRTNRDAGLSAPRLLLQSIQVNADAGRIPRAEENEISYLKIPIRGKDV